ncbi:MAG: PDZ domain-containing protein [Bacteroidia bacterium]|nr:PDZ domain-containing protein [Bacteroidia bacterium]
MKQTLIRLSAFVFAVALLAPAPVLAQKGEKDKEVKEKKEADQIIITRKGDKNEKVTVEINGDKITVNGKPLDEYKDKDGNISIRRNKFKDFEGLTLGRTPRANVWSYSGDEPFGFFSMDSNHAMLGVTTEKAEGGVEIQDITKESGAAKAGLKGGDIITKFGDTKIENPDDLSKAVREHKPGDKVVVTYLRDKKEQKTTAELTQWKGANALALAPGMNMDMNLDKIMPRLEGLSKLRVPYGQNWSWSGGGGPKLGLSVQDTDDGKGVKVIDVDDEGNANKAGIKEEDVITEVDGKAVNNTDEIAKIIKESKDKNSVIIKLQRSGKTQNIEVKIPRRLKTADL